MPGQRSSPLPLGIFTPSPREIPRPLQVLPQIYLDREEAMGEKRCSTGVFTMTALHPKFFPRPTDHPLRFRLHKVLPKHFVSRQKVQNPRTYCAFPLLPSAHRILSHPFPHRPRATVFYAFHLFRRGILLVPSVKPRFTTGHWGNRLSRKQIQRGLLQLLSRS
jgi:hypothetical protein